jgi:hypothetical protein
MKSITHKLRTLALAAGTLAVTATGASAAPDTNGYQSNDLLMFFRNPTGSVNSGRVIGFSLGSTWDVFRDGATPTDPSFGTVISLGNINTFLASSDATGGYGSDWTSLSSSIWVGAAGNNGSANAASSNTSNQDYARTLYLTKPRSGAGTYQQANSSLNDNLAGTVTTFQGATASVVAGIGAPFLNVMTNDVPRSVGNANSTIDDNNPITSGVAGKALNSWVTGGTMGKISSSTYTYGSISNVVLGLDLYRQTPVTNSSGWQNINNIGGDAGRGIYLGTITLSDNGHVNFVPRATSTTSGDDYSNWATNYPSATLTNKTADFDNDGFRNVDEYAFNTDPTKGNASLTTATVVSSNLIVSFQQRTGPTNVVPTYAVLTTTNLSTGFTTNSSIPFSTNTATSGYQQTSVTNPLSGARGFYRIQATLPSAN